VPRFETVQQVMAAIDDYAIPLVLFRPNSSDNTSWHHVDQVAEAARLDPPRWQELFRVTSVDPAVVLFSIRGNETKPLEAKQLTTLSAPRSLGAAE